MMSRRTLALYSLMRRQFSCHVQPMVVHHRQSLVIGMVTCRFASSHEITRSIEYLSQDNKLAPSKRPENNISATPSRPLLVLLSWLLAKRSHVMKYANLYLDQNFDVLMVTITPWQLMWPEKGSRAVVEDILDFLVRNENYQQIMLHGFSVGGYMWGEALDLIKKDEAKYGGIIDRVVGQVWDSAVDISELAIGTPKAIFPKNAVMQSMLQRYLEYHMRKFEKQATRYYIRSSQLFHTNIVKAPALMFVSKADVVGTLRSNESVRDSWESTGTQVYFKIFEDSPHVGHFRKYPKEYVKELYAYLNKLALIQDEEKIRAYL